MKAKEYAQQYNAAKTEEEKKEAIRKIIVGFVAEVKSLAQARKAVSNSALASIVKEQDDKWRAFARLVEDKTVDPDGFKNFNIRRFPYICNLLGWEKPNHAQTVR